MPQKRRKFSPQAKAEAVQIVLETDEPIAQVAKDLQINEGTPRETGSPSGGVRTPNLNSS